MTTKIKTFLLGFTVFSRCDRLCIQSEKQQTLAYVIDV